MSGRSLSGLDLCRFAFGDELHIEPRRGIGGFAFDPVFRKALVHLVVGGHGGQVGLVVPVFVIDADFVAALIPEVLAAFYLALDGECAGASVDDKVFDRGVFLADHAKVFDEDFRVGVCGHPAEADEDAVEDAVGGALRGVTHPPPSDRAGGLAAWNEDFPTPGEIDGKDIILRIADLDHIDLPSGAAAGFP